MNISTSVPTSAYRCLTQDFVMTTEGILCPCTRRLTYTRADNLSDVLSDVLLALARFELPVAGEFAIQAAIQDRKIQVQCELHM